MAHVTRRRFLTGMTGIAIGGAAARHSLSAKTSPERTAEEPTQEQQRTDTAVRGGLDYLVAHQNEEGCFGWS